MDKLNIGLAAQLNHCVNVGKVLFDSVSLLPNVLNRKIIICTSYVVVRIKSYFQTA